MFFKLKKKRKKRKSSITKHYVVHKEQARNLILNRIEFWNKYYDFSFKRVAIRNQKTCWGSCSSKKNLNFSYMILFLPTVLQDYIIVHELCHLKELNHSKNFWALVSKTIPDYKERKKQLNNVSKTYLFNRTLSL